MLGNFFGFLLKRASHFLRHHRRWSSTDEVLDRLVEDGLVIVSDFYDKEDIARLRDGIQRIATDPRIKTKRPEGVDDPAAQRIVNIRDLSPEVDLFYEDERIKQVFFARVTKGLKYTKGQYEIKQNIGVASYSDFVHFDDWSHRLKAILYLTDVSEENAPFVYYKKSHRFALWRLWKEFVHDHGFKIEKSEATNDYAGALFPDEFKTVQRYYQYEKVVCAAPAGSLIIFDARGLHSSTRLRSGTREVLVGYWMTDTYV
ncbi:MAG: phytanoyl-CoA dioxygenase family protein [Pseudomonadales bacterium]|nr:phytanoyl-CoA dioxygenase family protein [Pseudomonadales bacterium]